MAFSVPTSGQPVATEYTLSKLSEDHPDWDVWLVKVEYRGEGRWAVTHRHQCLNTAGEWVREPIPSSRTEDWLGRHRFPLEEAIDRAFSALRLVRPPCRGCGPDSATGEDIDVHPDCPTHNEPTGQWAACGLDDGGDADPWA